MTRRSARRRLRAALGEFAGQLPPGWVDAAVDTLRRYEGPDTRRCEEALVQAAADLVWRRRRREAEDLADRVRGGR